MTAVRARLQNSLALDDTSQQKLKFKQVQVVDQTTHPPKCHSFVGLDRQIGSSPPAEKETKQSSWIPVTTRGTHTHTHASPRGGISALERPAPSKARSP